jgi:hypothetical protein
VFNGGTLLVRVQTVPHAHVWGLLQVVTTRRSRATGSAGHHKATTSVIRLYAVPLHGAASAQGVYATRLLVDYQPPHALQARLQVTVRLGARTGTRSATVTIRPLPFALMLTPSSALSDTPLTLSVRTVPRARVEAIVRIPLVGPKPGARRATYQMTLRGEADARGRFSHRLRISYRVPRASRVQVAVTARIGQVAVRGIITAVIGPHTAPASSGCSGAITLRHERCI